MNPTALAFDFKTPQDLGQRDTEKIAREISAPPPLEHVSAARPPGSARQADAARLIGHQQGTSPKPLDFCRSRCSVRLAATDFVSC